MRRVERWWCGGRRLNGAYLSRISVLAEDDDQELEGLCCGAVSWPACDQAAWV